MPASTEGKDSDLVTFGKYLGKTYKEVAKDPEQTQWIMQSVEQDPKASPEMKRLADIGGLGRGLGGGSGQASGPLCAPNLRAVDPVHSIWRVHLPALVVDLAGGEA